MLSSVPSPLGERCAGYYGSAEANDAIQFLGSAGNITADFYLYGLTGS